MSSNALRLALSMTRCKKGRRPPVLREGAGPLMDFL
jgi:hypothetical protein